MHRTIRRALLVSLLALAGSACTSLPPPAPQTAAFSFVDYGDMPYGVSDANGRPDSAILDDIATRVGQSGTWPFVVHHGDLGRSPAVCNDAALEQVQQLWRDKFRVPVFYTPGDNEWEDCDRDDVKPPVSELSRLAAIRRILFAEPVAAPADWQVRAQPGMPENQRWTYHGVVFATFLLVGKENGRLDVRRDDPALAARLAEQRDHLNHDWIAAAFAQATAIRAAAVVLVTQADMFKPGAPDGQPDDSAPSSRCARSAVNAGYCAQITTLARRFGRPVLFIHGDTNAYCLDQPFPDNPAKLWRLNGPGDYKLLDAAIVTVQPSAAHPFAVTAFSSGTPFPAVCDYRR